jgi:peptide/nickel transport system permease protein
MSFQPVLLWTDALLWLLVAAVLAYVWHARRQEHTRAPWREVARSPLGMGAAVVLAVFTAIGLLDSMHFRASLSPGPDGQVRYASEVSSVLDLALGAARRTERSYSAPLAAQAYVKETLTDADGRQQRAYPRLKHGGVHLASPDEWLGDVLTRAATGALAGLTLWALLVAALLLVVRRGGRQQVALLLHGDTDFPWRSVLGVCGALLLLGGVVWALLPHYHLLGTDKVGGDVFYQAVKSIRTGLVIGTLTTLVTLPLAVLLGMAAGFFGGWVDDLIQYVYTTLNSIPGVLLIAAAVLLMLAHMESHPERFATQTERADARLLFMCVILGVTSWTGLARLLRAETLKLREMEYVQAAQALGVAPLTILLRHILPNVMHLVLITVALDFSGLVLAEAVLSYLSIGVDPAMPSWGNMINTARLELAREPVVWWPLAAAFVFMFALVLAANLFADAVRDAFDPRLRGARA